MKGTFEIHYVVQHQYPKTKSWYVVSPSRYGIKGYVGPINTLERATSIFHRLTNRIKDGTKFRVVAITYSAVEVR